MKEHVKTSFFLLFTSPLWALTIFGITGLAQRYPHAIDVLPLITVHYDPISGEYLLSGDYELVYPTLLLLVLTLIFLWKTKVSLQKFGALALLVPLITLIGAVVLSLISDHSGYRDDGMVLLVGFYIMPVISFLLGMAVCVICQKLIRGRSGG